MMDYVEMEEYLSSRLDIQEQFQETEAYYKAFFDWHRETYPEKWRAD